MDENGWPNHDFSRSLSFAIFLNIALRNASKAFTESASESESLSLFIRDLGLLSWVIKFNSYSFLPPFFK